MNTDDLTIIIKNLLRISPITAVGTQLALSQPHSLVLYTPHALIPYRQDQMVPIGYHDEVEQRKRVIEDALRKGVRLDYGKMDDQAYRHSSDNEGITEMLQDMYRELDAAVESGEYNEIEMCAEGVLGMIRSTIHPKRTDLLREGVERIKKGYNTYITHAEKEEVLARKQGNEELGDYFLETIDLAEEHVRELQDILQQCT